MRLLQALDWVDGGLGLGGWGVWGGAAAAGRMLGSQLPRCLPGGAEAPARGLCTRSAATAAAAAAAMQALVLFEALLGKPPKVGWLPLPLSLACRLEALQQLALQTVAFGTCCGRCAGTATTTTCQQLGPTSAGGPPLPERPDPAPAPRPRPLRPPPHPPQSLDVALEVRRVVNAMNTGLGNATRRVAG
jgi:hypothetical protein